jgi:hypothetical protein
MDKQADQNFRAPRVTVGRIVQIDHYSTPINGTRSSAAIVTQVWGKPEDEFPMVNVIMFADMQGAQPKGSVAHVSAPGEHQYAWRWPERV